MNESLEFASEYRCLLAKVEELLRVYRIAKKNDKNNALQERVRNKCNEIIVKLKTFSSFADVQQQYRNKIEAAFRDAKPEVPPSSKPSRENVEAPKPKQSQLSKKNGFSSVSSYSSYSSQSVSNAPPSVKKQKLTIEDKLKATSLAEKPKLQPVPAPKSHKNEVIQIKKVVETPKMESNPQIQSISDSMSSKSNKSFNQVKKQSSISTINNKFYEKQKSQESHESFLGMLDGNQSSDGDFNLNLRPQKSEEKIQTPPISLNSDTPKQEQFDKLSEASVVQNTTDTIINFCRDNKEKLNTQLIFNEDTFDYIRDQQGDFIYLIGVNKPQGKKMQKLYVCTLMKFSINEIFKCDDLFQKQTRDFKNNIRTPIGLIIKGDNASAIQPEHIKFLINLQCPYMVILVLKDFQQYDGVLCYFNQNTLDRIRYTPKKQLGQCADELAKKTYALPFNESYLPKQKTRYVITKHLNRTIAANAEEAPNAITISDNQCIRQQKNPFSYKVHQKFLTSLKTQHTIYQVNNGIVNSRFSYKTFESFKNEALALESKIPAIFSLTLVRDNLPVKKQFFQVLLQCKYRDPNIFLNLSNMNAKKCIVVALKPEVTMEMLDKVEPIQLKNFQKDTVLTYCVLIISKNNSKQFESDSKSELIELKSS